MKKILTIACTAAALAAPALASGSNDPATNAAKFCKQLANVSGGKHSDTYAQAVRALVGGGSKVTAKNAYGKCVSFKARENRHETAQAALDAHKNAAKECKDQQSTDAAGFAAQWGTSRNAYGKCVSSTAKKHEQEAAAEQRANDKSDINAAKKCKTQRREDPSGFATQWGTSRNAYGKCVSKTASGKNGS